jgi:hypothetical protein
MNANLINNSNFTSNDINSLLYNLQQDTFSNKKEWIDIYKKNVSLLRNEEKNLINTFLSQDFHLTKLYKNTLEEENTENNAIKDNIKLIRNQITEAGNIFKGVKLVKNKEIRVKLNKLEENINKIRLDFKSRFENLLNEEELLEKEIMETQLRLENGEFNKMFPENEIVDNKENIEEREINNTKQVMKNNFISETGVKTKGISFEKIMEQIENEKKYFNYIYSIDEIIRFSESFINLAEVKETISILDNKITDIGGPTQGWENKDHQEFLKLRTQHKNKINTLDFLSDLENALPYLSRGELKTHINLFNKFEKLNNVKKVFLDRYKSIKEEQDQEKKVVMLEKVDQKEKNTKNKMKDHVKSIEDKKKQVEEWKKIKEKEQALQQQAKYEKENAQREKDRQKFLEIIEKNKVVLDEYYKQKELENFQKDLQDNTNVQTKKNISEIDLERIKEKNMILEEKRKLMVKSKSIKSIRDNENYKKYQMKKVEKMAKVESKLDYKTTAVIQKQRTKHDFQSNKEASTMANNVLGRMTRAVPEWRKSLV